MGEGGEGIRSQGGLKRRPQPRLAPGCAGAWSRGPNLWGCDRGTGHKRVATVPMRVFAVRSHRAPLPRYDAHIHRQADGTRSTLSVRGGEGSSDVS